MFFKIMEVNAGLVSVKLQADVNIWIFSNQKMYLNFIFDLKIEGLFAIGRQLTNNSDGEQAIASAITGKYVIL